MIIGKGLIAKLFKDSDREDVVFFASGVSNSLETNKIEFQREEKLLRKTIKETTGKLLVYFSTCSIYDTSKSESAYILHKLRMENIIKEFALDYLILRVSNAVGKGGNPHLLLNYIVDHIYKNKPINLHTKASRNLIDVGDFKVITLLLLDKKERNTTINIASPYNYTVNEIVSTVETLLGIKAIINPIETGKEYEVSISKVRNYFIQKDKTDKTKYLIQLIKKSIEYQNMEISILLALYNSEPFIKRCLKSIVSQTFTNYEIILVDDASKDNGLAIAEQFLQKHCINFQSVKHKQNKYLATTRNTGIKVAKGKYIMFIDQDDELAHNEVLSLFYKTIEEEKVDFVCANYSAIFSNTDIRRGEYIKGITSKKRLQNEEVLSALLYTEISVTAWNKLFNREFLLTNNLRFPKGLMHEDELWAFQVALKTNSCYCLPDYTYNYYKNNPNSIAKNRNKKSYEDKIAILKEQLNIMNKQELLKKNSPNAFIFHFKRISQEVLRPKLLNNNYLWGGYYKKIKCLYRQSELWQHKKLFRLPAYIAYWIRKEKRRNRLNNGNRYYGKFLDKINQYNWD